MFAMQKKRGDGICAGHWHHGPLGAITLCVKETSPLPHKLQLTGEHGSKQMSSLEASMIFLFLESKMSIHVHFL